MTPTRRPTIGASTNLHTGPRTGMNAAEGAEIVPSALFDKPLQPLGGDLVATGTLAISRLSLLVVAYSQVGNDIDKSPSILLDISGEL